MLQQSTALNLLAQYSDSEEESNEKEVETNVNETTQYRQADSSDSSSSSSESDDEIFVKQIRKKLEEHHSGSDDDSENEHEGTAKERKKKPPIKVKGELLLEDLPPIQDLEIEVDEKECLEIGTVTSIVDQLVLVEGYQHSAPLDIDSVLFLDCGKKALGKVFDVIGQVSAPIYCIRFNSHEDIVAKNINTGDKVFCAPRTEYSSFVILTNIMGRGSDASWKNDVEVPNNMIEYSDDEEERKARRPNRKSQNTQERPVMAPRRRLPPHGQQYSWHNQIHQQQPNVANPQNQQWYPPYNYNMPNSQNRSYWGT